MACEASFFRCSVRQWVNMWSERFCVRYFRKLMYSRKGMGPKPSLVEDWLFRGMSVVESFSRRRVRGL
jgi:hypothetical protein